MQSPVQLAEALGRGAAEFYFGGRVAEFDFESGAEGGPCIHEVEAQQGGAVEL